MQQPIAIKTLTNTGYSFLGYSLPIIFAIIITPVIVRGLGINDFGIYMLINSINGFLGLVDLGIGLSVVKYVAEYQAIGEAKRLNNLVGSANILFLAIGLFGCLVYFLISRYFLGFFNISPQQQVHIAPVFALAGLVFFVSSLTTMAVNILKAMQRYDLSVKISLFSVAVYNILALILVLMGFHLKAIFLANLVLSVFALLVSVIIAKRAAKIRILHFDWSFVEVKRCYRFGLAAFVTNISNNTLSYLDRLVIPAYLSPAQLSFYSLPGSVADKVTGITGSSTGVLFPMLSSLKASNQTTQINNVYIRMFRNIPVLAVAMGVSIALFANKILFYWVGRDFADKGTKVLIILAATNVILAVYGSLNNFLLGFGKVRFLMKMSFFMAGLNVLFLIWLVPRYGILGAAWAYLFSVLPSAFAVFWVEKRFLQLSGRMAFYAKLLGKLAAVSAVFSATYFMILGRLVNSLISLIIVGGLSVPLFLVIYKLLGFSETEDWLLFKNYARSVFKK